MIENKFLQTDYQSRNLCHAWVATAVVGAGVIGAGASIYGANKAASAQENAAAQAAATQKAMYDTTRGDLQPFRDIGTNAGTQLTSRLSELTSPITMDQATLEKTPGYQFTKTQGLKAVQNGVAARGLAVSGAALKGAANFATGLADNTYKTQFDIANTNQSNAFNRLKSLVDTGENAAAQTGTVGANTANQISGAQIGAGNAAAAADNSIGSAIGKAASSVGGYAAYKGLYGSPAAGGSAPAGYYGGNPASNPNLVPV